MKNRRILVVLLALVMVMVSFPVTAFAVDVPLDEVPVTVFTYDVGEDRYVVVEERVYDAGELLGYLNQGRTNDTCDDLILSIMDAYARGEAVSVVTFTIFEDQMAARNLPPMVGWGYIIQVRAYRFPERVNWQLSSWSFAGFVSATAHLNNWSFQTVDSYYMPSTLFNNTTRILPVSYRSGQWSSSSLQLREPSRVSSFSVRPS